MLTLFSDLAQIAHVELEGHVPRFTRGKMDTLESLECAQRGAGRLRVLEVKLRDFIAAYPRRILNIGLNREWQSGLKRFR